MVQDGWMEITHAQHHTRATVVGVVNFCWLGVETWSKQQAPLPETTLTQVYTVEKVQLHKQASEIDRRSRGQRKKFSDAVAGVVGPSDAEN